MLLGFAPFRCPDRIQLFNLIKKAKVPTECPVWQRISTGAKTLILKMLTTDIEARVTAHEVSLNEWIQKAFD
jgi:calcium-dependent protein kinase